MVLWDPKCVRYPRHYFCAYWRIQPKVGTLAPLPLLGTPIFPHRYLRHLTLLPPLPVLPTDPSDTVARCRVRNQQTFHGCRSQYVLVALYVLVQRHVLSMAFSDHNNQGDNYNPKIQRQHMPYAELAFQAGEFVEGFTPLQSCSVFSRFK